MAAFVQEQSPLRQSPLHELYTNPFEFVPTSYALSAKPASGSLSPTSTIHSLNSDIASKDISQKLVDEKLLFSQLRALLPSLGSQVRLELSPVDDSVEG